MKTQNGWQLDEDGPDIYERYIVPAFSGAWAEDMVKRAKLKGGDRVLDVACGTGIVSRRAYEVMGSRVHLTGVDVNEAVLEKGRDICTQNGIPVNFHQGSAGALPYDDVSVEVVLCQQGLQYFPDQGEALADIRRVLVPGGRAVFSVWRPLEYSPFYQALHRALERYVNETAAGILAAAYSLGSHRELRALFTSSGFEEIDIRLVIKQMHCPNIDNFLAAGISAAPFAKDIASLTKSRRKEMFRMILETSAGYMDDHGLAAPMAALLVSTRAPQ